MCGVVLRARLFRQGIPRRGIAASAVCMVQTQTRTALVHYRHANCNFAVIHFFWDRILGTYRKPDARFRGQKGFPNQLVSYSKPHLLSRCDLESNAAWKSLY